MEPILVVSDDPSFVTFVANALATEGFLIVAAADGDEAIATLVLDRPAAAVVRMSTSPGFGPSICRGIRSRPEGRHLPIVMVARAPAPWEQVVAYAAGADDFIFEPVEPDVLVARLKRALVRRHELGDASPLTGLPGNNAIRAELRSRLDAGEAVALLHADLDNFKPFNDRYGFDAGDRAILRTRDVLAACLDAEATFFGHIGGDDFVIVARPREREDVEELCALLARAFDREVPTIHPAGDVARGSYETTDRQGYKVRLPLLSISIGAATNLTRGFHDYREMIDAANEMKAVAKRCPGSSFAVDRRSDE